MKSGHFNLFCWKTHFIMLKVVLMKTLRIYMQRKWWENFRVQIQVALTMFFS